VCVRACVRACECVCSEWINGNTGGWADCVYGVGGWED
jgi:hypothetical protein